MFDLIEAEYLDSTALRFSFLRAKPYIQRKALIVLAATPRFGAWAILQVAGFKSVFTHVPKIEKAFELLAEPQPSTQTW